MKVNLKRKQESSLCPLQFPNIILKVCGNNCNQPEKEILRFYTLHFNLPVLCYAFAEVAQCSRFKHTHKDSGCNAAAKPKINFIQRFNALWNVLSSQIYVHPHSLYAHVKTENPGMPNYKCESHA